MFSSRNTTSDRWLLTKKADPVEILNGYRDGMESVENQLQTQLPSQFSHEIWYCIISGSVVHRTHFHCK